MRILIVSLFFISKMASAALLDDVKILNVMPGRDNLELKLQTKDGSENSYFYVDIVKSDPEALEKLVKVVQKLLKKDKYKLDLKIISFSLSPSGSYYRSEAVTFYGPMEREPNSLTKPKAKNYSSDKAPK